MEINGLPVIRDNSIAWDFKDTYTPIPRKPTDTVINVRVIIRLQFFDGPRYRSVPVPEGVGSHDLEGFKRYVLFKFEIASKYTISTEIYPQMMFRKRGEFRYKLVDSLPDNIYIV